MPGTEIWNVEWPNVNTQRKYPFDEGQSLTDGDFVLPDDFLVDMVLPVNIGTVPAPDPTLFHVSQVGVFSSGFTVSIAYNGVTFATVTIPKDSFVEYSNYDIIGIGDFFDTRGTLTVGQIDTISKYPGAWNFTVDTAKILPTIIRPNLRALTSLRIANGTDQSAPITGDVVLRAGQNFRFRVVGNVIYFDAIRGENLQESCVCNDMDVLAPPIRSINMVTGDANGNITLLGTSCVMITPGANSLSIEDQCSEPCCDCRELQVVTDDLEQMLNQVRTLEDTAVRLDDVITNTSNNILASKTTGIPRY